MNIALILTTNYPDSLWSLDGEDYSGLTWLSDTPKPTKAALEKQWADVEYKTAVADVKRLRQIAYIEESDPIFFQLQRDATFKQEDWHAKIAEIEARYPYPVLEKPE